ncbi:TonB-dependent receptor [Ramlibacter sp. MMS24-I3-19]|uniref:TonB-dependent receptor n=1 Tax=Ramlibacter sp. MMS24-I3-19 TaxID=3416606 RepID=UPI003D03562A
MTAGGFRWITLGAAAFVALAARAQSATPDDDRVHALPQVDVIHRTPLPGLDVPTSLYPGHAQQATDGAIERAGAGTLPEFMNRRLLGVNVNEVQGSPYQVDVNYRGQRLSPLLGTAQGLSLWLDGVRINQPFGDVAQWDLLPEGAIAGLALVPGSNPLYGLNTLGGALVLTTKSGLTHAGTEADFSVGSAGRRRIEVGHGQQWDGGWHAYVAASAFEERGWRDRSPGRLGNVFIKAGRQQGQDGWTVSLLDAGSRLTGNGLLNESLSAIDQRAVYTTPDITRNHETLLTVQDTRVVAGGSRLTLQGWHRRGRRDASTGDIAEDWREWLGSCVGNAMTPPCSDPTDPGYVSQSAVFNRSRSRQQETGAALQWSRRVGTHDVAVGADAAAARVSHDQFSRPAAFDAMREAIADLGAGETHDVSLQGRTRRVGLFAADTVALREGTHLSLSARWDGTQVRNDLGQPAPLTRETFRYGKLNPALGLTQVLGESVTLFGSASQGTRVPTALELGCADAAHPCVLPTGLQSDPALKQVVARTLEAGARVRLGSLQWSGAVFRTSSQDDIVFVRSGVSQAGYFTNVDRTQRQGVELAAQQHRGAWDWQAGYTFLDATYRSGLVLPGPLSTGAQPNQVTRGSPIAGLPRHVLKLAADWRFAPRWTIGADWQAAASQAVAGNEGGSRPGLGHLPGFAVLHARVRWQFSERWQAYLRVHNVFDRRYATFAAGNVDLFPVRSCAAARRGAAGRAVHCTRGATPVAGGPALRMGSVTLMTVHISRRGP